MEDDEGETTPRARRIASTSPSLRRLRCRERTGIDGTASSFIHDVDGGEGDPDVLGRASTSSAIVSTDSDADEGDERIRTDADVEGDSSPTLARESSTARASRAIMPAVSNLAECSETTGRDAPKSSRALSRNPRAQRWHRYTS